MTSLSSRISTDVTRIPCSIDKRQSASGQFLLVGAGLHHNIGSRRQRQRQRAVPRRAVPRRAAPASSAVAVFESPLDAKQTARLHTRSRLSATDSAVETAVTKPQATTAPTVAKGQQGTSGPTGAKARTGDAVNPLTSLLPCNI